MGYVEKRGRRYRARYRDPLGRLTSKSFTHKADAERFVREMDVDVERGAWLDPRAADVPLATWAAEFLALARRSMPRLDPGKPTIIAVQLPANGPKVQVQDWRLPIDRSHC